MILNILTTYGIAYLLTESFLLEKPRNYIAKKGGSLHRKYGILLYMFILLDWFNPNW
jgi:hypothetical protein